MSTFVYSSFVGLLIITLISSSFGSQPIKSVLFNLTNAQPGSTYTEKYKLTDERKVSFALWDINSSINWLIFQVHTFTENVTLSYTSSNDIHSYVKGTNIGLYWEKNYKKFEEVSKDSCKFFVRRDKDKLINGTSLTVMVAIATYGETDPVPGGCNMEFETEKAPYQKVKYNDDIITVNIQPPSEVGPFCKNESIKTDMYRLYLNEYDNSEESYFNGIKMMLSVENITKFGKKILPGDDPFQRKYNLYRGTGEIFAAIATINNKSAAYVPAHSFGCNLTLWHEDCIGPVGIHWRFTCATLFIIGLFVCFVGHRFFKITMYIVGYLVGVTIILFMVEIDHNFDKAGKAIFALITGVFFGIFWCFVWWQFGVPLLSAHLTFVLAGILVASIVFFNEMNDVLFYNDNVIFWVTFGIIVLIVITSIFYKSHVGHIIALSLLGSYGTIVAINFYVGGNLPYIIINTYRRLSVEGFSKVITDPPFQMLDITQSVLWVLIFSIGVYYQLKDIKGKPPFPPHRNGHERNRTSNDENAPLLGSQNVHRSRVT